MNKEKILEDFTRHLDECYTRCIMSGEICEEMSEYYKSGHKEILEVSAYDVRKHLEGLGWDVIIYN